MDEEKKSDFEVLMGQLGVDFVSLELLSVPMTVLVCIIFALQVWAKISELREAAANTPSSFFAVISVFRKVSVYIDKFARGPVFIVVVFGITANLAGYSIRAVYPGLLFLDMGGTAAVALSCGPFWGLFVGVLTNTIMSFLDSSPVQPMLIAFAHTNATGGVVWGILAIMFKLNLWETGKFRLNAVKILCIALIALPLISWSQLYVQLHEPNFFFPRLPTDIESYQPGDQQYGIFVEGWIVFDAFWRTMLSIFPDKFLAVVFGYISIWLLFPVSKIHSSVHHQKFFHCAIVPGVIGLVLIVSISTVAHSLYSGEFEIYLPDKIIPFWSFLIFGLVFSGVLWVTHIGENSQPAEPIKVSAYFRYRINAQRDRTYIKREITVVASILFSLLFSLLLYLPWTKAIDPEVEVFKFLVQCLIIMICYFVAKEIVMQNRYHGDLHK